MTMQRLLRSTKGSALIFFLEDELDIVEDKLEVLCHTLSKQYECRVWYNYIWDAIFMDIDHCCKEDIVFSVIQEYRALEYPDRQELNDVMADVTKMIQLHVLSNVTKSGYYVYAYTEFI